MFLGGSSSDKSLQSLGKLSHQDLMGYTTLRSIRKSPRYLEEPAYNFEEITTDTAWDLPASFMEEFTASFETSTSSVKRFSVQGEENSYTDDRCYMGISIPHNINNLFLNSSDHKRREDEKSLVPDDELIEFKLNTWKHDIEQCFFCSRKERHEDDNVFLLRVDPLQSVYDPDSPDGNYFRLIILFMCTGGHAKKHSCAIKLHVQRQSRFDI